MFKTLQSSGVALVTEIMSNVHLEPFLFLEKEQTRLKNV